MFGKINILVLNQMCNNLVSLTIKSTGVRYTVYVVDIVKATRYIHFKYLCDGIAVSSKTTIDNIYDVEILPEKERVKWILIHGS